MSCGGPMSLAVRNVLVVDDDERILAMYKRSFDEAWRVHCASNVPAAQALARTQPFEAAVLDLHVGPASSVPLLRNAAHREPADPHHGGERLPHDRYDRRGGARGRRRRRRQADPPREVMKRLFERCAEGHRDAGHADARGCDRVAHRARVLRTATATSRRPRAGSASTAARCSGGCGAARSRGSPSAHCTIGVICSETSAMPVHGEAQAPLETVTISS